MDCITRLLGTKVKCELWPHEKELPYFISDFYSCELASIEGAKAIFLYPNSAENLERPNSIKKRIAKIQSLEPLPVVIVSKMLTRWHVQSFLKDRIPFVIPEKQIYLPFLGVALQNKFAAENKIVERFQPAAQMLFLSYMYGTSQELLLSAVAKQIGFSAMTASRAAKQLEQTGLFYSYKCGANKLIGSKLSSEKLKLFIKIKPFLISPVRKKIYVWNKTELSYWPISSISALAEHTMINSSETKCYAASSSSAFKNEHFTEQLVDDSQQSEVEIWKYDPQIFARNGIVDAISLAMSLKNEQDERIQNAVEELLYRTLR